MLVVHSKSQNDTAIQHHHVIKVAKPTTDTVYTYVRLSFYKFTDKKKNTITQSPSISICPPAPVVSAENGTKKVNLSQYFEKKLNAKSADLKEKLQDTITFEITVLKNGKTYCKDVTPLMVLNGVPAYFDKKENVYVVDDIHWKCLNTVKRIETWRPAYIQKEVIGRFKGQKVIKPKNVYLNAQGKLTIILSKTPIMTDVQ